MELQFSTALAMLVTMLVLTAFAAHRDTLRARRERQDELATHPELARCYFVPAPASDKRARRMLAFLRTREGSYPLGDVPLRLRDAAGQRF